MTVKMVMWRKLVAARIWPSNISSRMVRIDSSDVSLNSPMNMLPIGGMMMRTACGKMTRRITWTRDIPMASAASVCPRSTASIPAR